MKKFLIALALFGVAEFALADEMKNNIFGTEFEFDIDEYANKPCGDDWSEFEKKICNMDRNSYLQMTQEDAQKWHEAMKPCMENPSKPECERHKISWAKHRKIALEIALECDAENAESCYEMGRSFITEIHDPRSAKFAAGAFNVGCNLKSAKNCEQLGLLLVNADQKMADEVLTKTCEMDKNHCDGLAVTTKNLDLAKKMCDDGNAFGCGAYLNLAGEENVTMAEANRMAEIIQDFCKSDIDKKVEHLRAMFISSAKFEEFKISIKTPCAKVKN